jgi:hypothetical protein
MDFTTLTMEKQKHSHHYSDKPPYAERHVRWCERTVGELIPHLLLDCSKKMPEYPREICNAPSGLSVVCQAWI